jgi:DNA-binding phage protein
VPTLDTSYHKRRLTERLKDERFREEFERAQREIAQVDAVMQELDERRVAQGLSKAQIARHIGKNPATVRRLFSNQARNPELKTVAAIAEAVGAEIYVKPRSRQRRGASAA